MAARGHRGESKKEFPANEKVKPGGRNSEKIARVAGLFHSFHVERGRAVQEKEEGALKDSPHSEMQ